jgi:hypothetical protein
MGRAHLLPVEVHAMRTRKCNSTFSATRNGKTFQLEGGGGSSVVSKDLASILKLSFRTVALFFGHNPTNSRDRMRLTNSKVSSIDIQFFSSRLIAVIRGSSSICRDDGDTPVKPARYKADRREKEEKNVNKYNSATEVKNRRQAEALTFSSSRHCVKMLCHGLLSLGMLLVGIS